MVGTYSAYRVHIEGQPIAGSGFEGRWGVKDELTFKGSPGPWQTGSSKWEIADTGDHDYCIFIKDANSKLIVDNVTTWNIDDEISECNSKLIAAAPEMLDLILDLKKTYHSSPHIQIQCNKVLRKALGIEITDPKIQ